MPEVTEKTKSPAAVAAPAVPNKKEGPRPAVPTPLHSSPVSPLTTRLNGNSVWPRSPIPRAT
jgi:hypothetical protein